MNRAEAMREAPSRDEGSADLVARKARRRSRPLFDVAMRDPQAPLPHRDALEARFGQDLSDISVRRGAGAKGALAEAGAAAASVDGEVILRDENVPEEVVAHEVTHALAQREGTVPGVELWGSTAERAAFQAGRGSVTQGPWPVPAERPREVAFLDASVWMPPRVTQEGSLDLDRWIRERGGAAGAGAFGEAAVAPTEATTDTLDVSVAEPAAEAAESAEATDDGSTDTSADVSEEPKQPEPVAEPEQAKPAAAAPAASEAKVEVAPAAAAEPTAEEAPAEQATAELAAGASPTETLDGFAALTPSQQALAYPQLGGALSESANTATETVKASIQPPSVVTEGAAEAPTLATDFEVAPSAMEPLPEEPVPTVDVTVPELAPAEPVVIPAGEEALSGVAPEATAAEKASLATAAFDAPVSVDVETSPGPAPGVPLEGGADPARMDEASQAGLADAGAASAEVSAALVAAPTADDLVPVAREVAPELPPLQAEAAVEAPADVTGMAMYREMGAAPEVQAAFDARMAESAAASAATARDAAQAAADERDAAQVAAETEADTAVTAAEETHAADQEKLLTEQRAAVTSARTQTEQAQTAELTALEGELGTEAEAQRKAVSDNTAIEQDKVDTEWAGAETKAENAQQQATKDVQAERDATNAKAGEESWWDQGVDALKGAIDSFASAIQGVIDTLRSAVKGFFDAAAKLATTFIQAAVDFAKAAVSAYADFVKKLVDELLGEIFPGLAAALKELIDAAAALYLELIDTIGGALESAVNAAIQALAAAIDGALAAYSNLVNMAATAYKAALDGDWSAVLQLVIEGLLLLFGLDPGEFWGLVGKAEGVWQAIVDDPVQFGKNVLSAAWLGITQFGTNIGGHLQKGFVAWLTGAFAGSLTLPESWDLWGVLDVVRQVMGLTKEGMLKLARKALPDAAVDALEYVLDLVTELVDGGWGAVWEKILADVQGLVEAIVPEILEWAVVQLVKAALPKLLAFIDPTFIAAFVTALQMMWGAYEFLRDQFQRMYGVVTTVVEAMANLAAGVVQPAADRIEGVLGEGVPLILDLLAKLMGVNVAAGVRGVIDKARDWVENAIISLAKRFLAMFTGGKKTPEEEEEPAEDEPGAVDYSALLVKREVTLPDETVHHIYVRGEPGQFEVVMASTGPNVITQSEELPDTQQAQTEAKQVVAAVDKVNKDVEDKEKTPAEQKEAKEHVQTANTELDQTEKAIEGGKVLTYLEAYAADLEKAHPQGQPDLVEALDRLKPGPATPGGSDFPVMRTLLGGEGVATNPLLRKGKLKYPPWVLDVVIVAAVAEALADAATGAKVGAKHLARTDPAEWFDHAKGKGNYGNTSATATETLFDRSAEPDLRKAARDDILTGFNNVPKRYELSPQLRKDLTDLVRAGKVIFDPPTAGALMAGGSLNVTFEPEVTDWMLASIERAFNDGEISAGTRLHWIGQVTAGQEWHHVWPQEHQGQYKQAKLMLPKFLHNFVASSGEPVAFHQIFDTMLTRPEGGGFTAEEAKRIRTKSEQEYERVADLGSAELEEWLGRIRSTLVASYDALLERFGAAATPAKADIAAALLRELESILARRSGSAPNE